MIRKSLACVAAFILTAGLAATMAKAQPSGTLRVAVGADPATFDPHFNDLPTGNTVDKLVFDGLFRLDAENNVVANLATGYGFSDNGLRFTVQIHAGRTFSNGDPLNAQAVAASFMRLLDPKVGAIYRGLYAVIDEVVALDATTVEFRLKEPNGHILLLLAASTGSIINVDALQKMGSAYSRQPVGSGPYLVESFVGGERYRLVPNPSYQGDYPATLEAIEFIVAPEDASRMALLETGAVDIVERVPPEALDTIRALPHAQVIMPPSMFSINMEMLMEGALKDLRVREALNLAVDREGIIKGILGGLATPSVGMPGPGTQDSLRVTFDPIPYDPDRARALLAQAGYPPGALQLSMTCPIGRYIKDVQVCQALQGLFQAVGIDAQANIVDRGSWSKAASTPLPQRKENMLMIGRGTAGMDFTLYRLFYKDVGANTTGFNHPRVNALLTEGRAATDLTEQQRIYAEIQKIIWDEKPFIFLWYQTQALGVHNRVRGFAVQPNEDMLFDRVTLVE